MGRASVKGFGQVKNSGEDLFLHRFKTQIQKLTFSFSLQRHFRTEGSPCPGFALPSVVSLKAATLCLVQIWPWVPIFPAYSTFADNLRAYGISRNLVPARDLVVPVVRCSAFLRTMKFRNCYSQTVAVGLCA